MQFTWRVPPLGNEVQLTLGAGGKEEVTIDGFSVSSRYSNDARSVHVLPLEGRDAKVIITVQGGVPSAVLEVDGQILPQAQMGHRGPPRTTATVSAPEQPTPRTKDPVLGMIGSLLGVGGGIAASRLFGVSLLFPVGFWLVFQLVLLKVIVGRSRPFVFPVSLLWAQTGWMVVGGLFIGDVPGRYWLEISAAFFAGGLILMWPSRVLALVLAGLAGWYITFHVEAFHQVAGKEMRAGAALHILLRLGELLGFLIGAWLVTPDADAAGSHEVPPASRPVVNPVGSLVTCRGCRFDHAASEEQACPRCGTPYGAHPSSAPPVPPSTTGPRPTAARSARPARSASRPPPVPAWRSPQALAGAGVALVVIGTAAAVMVSRGASPAIPVGHAVHGSVKLTGASELYRVTVTVGDYPAELNEQGEYRLENVPPGTYRVLATAPSTVEGEASAELVVGDQPVTEAPPLQLTAVAKVSGRVVVEDAFGGPVGPPARPAELSIRPHDLHLKTDAQGAFSVDVPPGEVELRVEVEGHPPVIRSLSLGWAPERVDLPNFPAATNVACAPVALSLRQGAQDLVSGTSVRPDGRNDGVIELTPCRDGTLRRVQLVERADTWTRWDTTPGLHGALGVAKRSAPQELLNQTPPLRAAVSRQERLLLYVSAQPRPMAEYEVLVEYDDRTVYRAELPSAFALQRP